MNPFLVVYDVIEVPGGDLAICGTDEYFLPEQQLLPKRFVKLAILLTLRGGLRVAATALDIDIRSALSGKRNIYLKIPKVVDDMQSLRGAIVSADGVDAWVAEDDGGGSCGSSATPQT